MLVNCTTREIWGRFNIKHLWVVYELIVAGTSKVVGARTSKVAGARKEESTAIQ